jgi:malonyl-CoA/methylmalonyl-CoA synthetase
MPNANLFAALRAAFPADLDAVAVETDSGLRYTWRDLDRATAMVANLLQSLDIPGLRRHAAARGGAGGQVGRGPDPVPGHAARGFVFLPLNTAYQSGEIEYFIGNAEPAVVVCTGKNFAWVSPIAFRPARATSSR